MSAQEITAWIDAPKGQSFIEVAVLADRIAQALWPATGGTDDEEFSQGFTCAEAHTQLKRELRADAISGLLPVHDPLTRGPHKRLVGEAFLRGLVKVADLPAYLALRGMGLRAAPATAGVATPDLAQSVKPAAQAAPKEQQAPPLENWKMRIQAEAAAEWKRLRAMGCNPTRASIRPHLLKWCRDNDVKTSPGGINPSDGYLRTHVLGGNHWAPPDD